MGFTLATVLVTGGAVALVHDTQAWADASSAVIEAADEASALALAKQTGREVRITSATTETSEFYATPAGEIDGTLAAGLVRFRRDNQWVPVDLTLQQQPDGSVVPRAHPDGLRLSGERNSSSGVLATVGDGADEVSMGWPGPLPAPELDGNRAVYPEVAPGADLVVEATRTGFEQYVVVKSVAAARNFLTINLPLSGPGAHLIEAGATGGLAMHDEDGQHVATVPAPLMWDAQVAANGETPSRTAEVDVTTVKPPTASSSRRAAADAPASATVTLRLAPDQAWLESPDTQYPVTIDPQVDKLLTTFDTTVMQGVTTGMGGANYLRLGVTSGDTAQIARSFVHWDSTVLRGKEITKATAFFFNWYSTTCAATPWEIWTTNPASSETRWPSQPRWIYKEAVSTQTKGFDASCGDGWVSIDAKSFFQHAATANQTRAHMGIRASNETNKKQWKEFRSRNADITTQVPYAQVTYAAVPSAEDPWTEEPDVAATDGSDVAAAVIPDDDHADPGEEDPEGSAQASVSASAVTTESTWETFEELEADDQLEDEVSEEDLEEPDQPASAAAMAADDGCTTTGDDVVCIRPATAETKAQAEAAKPGALSQAQATALQGEPLDDVSLGDPNVEPLYSVSASRIPKPKQMPSACYDRIRTGKYTWLRTRFSGCRAMPWDWEFWRVSGNSLVFVGKVSFYEYLYIYTKRNSRTWVYQIGISPYAFYGNTAGIKIDTGRKMSCSTTCKAKWRLPAASLGYNKVDGVGTIQSKVAKGRISTLTANWAYRISIPGSVGPGLSPATPKVRCDQKLKGYARSVGCVVPDVVPTLTYSLNGSYPQLARHIRDAQGSQLAGKYPKGTPMTRLTSTSESDTNRRRACPSSLTRPSGRSCDEYPFASTYQGASTGGGSARTFSWCSIPGTATGVTGSTGYSRCMINAPQNSKGGRVLQTFYSQNRMMNKDKFRVRIS